MYIQCLHKNAIQKCSPAIVLCTLLENSIETLLNILLTRIIKPSILKIIPNKLT